MAEGASLEKPALRFITVAMVPPGGRSQPTWLDGGLGPRHGWVLRRGPRGVLVLALGQAASRLRTFFIVLSLLATGYLIWRSRIRLLVPNNMVNRGVEPGSVRGVGLLLPCLTRALWGMFSFPFRYILTIERVSPFFFFHAFRNINPQPLGFHHFYWEISFSLMLAPWKAGSYLLYFPSKKYRWRPLGLSWSEGVCTWLHNSAHTFELDAHSSGLVPALWWKEGPETQKRPEVVWAEISEAQIFGAWDTECAGCGWLYPLNSARPSPC